MTDAGDERRSGERGRGRKEPGKKAGKPGKKARKARGSRRLRASRGRRRAHLILAIAHPVRRSILRFYVERGEPLTPAQVAKMLGLPIGLVAYHVSVLKRLGGLEPSEEQQAQGAIGHFYDATIADDKPIETLLEETRDDEDEDVEKRKNG